MKQLVRGHAAGEPPHGACSTTGGQIQAIATEGCDRHVLCFPPGRMLIMNKVKKATGVPLNFVHFFIGKRMVMGRYSWRIRKGETLQAAWGQLWKLSGSQGVCIAHQDALPAIKVSDVAQQNTGSPWQ